MFENDYGLGQKIFYGCATGVRLTVVTILLGHEFFMAIGFLMGVMTISLALPTDL